MFLLRKQEKYQPQAASACLKFVWLMGKRGWSLCKYAELHIDTIITKNNVCR